MSDIEEIGSFGSAFEARLVVAHLESLGITASVVTDNAGGAYPSLTGLSGGARLMVRTEDVDRAREAMEEFDSRAVDAEPSDAGDQAN
ncbi:MAG: putative signal transducing protein [Acidimicrobiia bacterium]